ncbi:MAG: inorganic diphosphatase [Proteobacteria bacterium]|nr:inorganic diphosphatase [Pseudomonadota bacterium]
MDLTAIPHRLNEATGLVRAVIEVPSGTRCKYSYDPETEAFEFDQLLPEGMTWPLEFGFIPATLGDDGDPLDIMVLSDEPLPVGAIASVRLIGVLEAVQTEHGESLRNDRLLAVTEETHRYAGVKTVEDLGPKFLEHLTRFWVAYNDLRGRRFEAQGVRSAEEAMALIRRQPGGGPFAQAESAPKPSEGPDRGATH